jgi:molybdopterin-guanine dinucleotide biosynthesis protein A
MGKTLIAGLILAGGAARRLGGVDKPLLTIGSSTMLSRIIAALDLAEIAISANGDAARFAAFGRPVLGDGRFAGEGPLAGLLAGLDWGFSIAAKALLTVPGDTPFVPRGLAASLAPPPSCAVSHGRVHHLVALWPVEARIPLRERLSRPGPRDVASFAEMIGVRRVDFPLATWDSFLNVNTPADLAVARAQADHVPMEGGALG